MPLNILTFNWHGPYICLLAKTGHFFEVVLRLKGGRKEWLVEQRPVPENIILISEEHALRKCYCHFYDIIICQNIDDLLLVKDLGWKPDVFFKTAQNLFKIDKKY